MGTGQLSLRGERRGRRRKAKIRSLLHPALLAEAGCHDRVKNVIHNALWQGTLSKDQMLEVTTQRSEAAKRINSAKDLAVYQVASGLAMEIFEVSKHLPPEERYALTTHIRSSSRSVCLNVREAWRSGDMKPTLSAN